MLKYYAFLKIKRLLEIFKLRLYYDNFISIHTVMPLTTSLMCTTLAPHGDNFMN